jgi:hypothetical protein
MAGIIGPSILSLRRRIHGSAGQTASSPPAGAPPATRLKAVVRDAKGRIVRKFDEDQAAGLFHAHISALAVIRDRDGAIVESFGRDMPFQTLPSLLEDTRHRRFLFQERVELPPGHYTLETAVQDRLAGHYNATTKAFTVAPPEAKTAWGSAACRWSAA